MVADAYSVEAVERLLGLHEPRGSRGHRDVTIADIISWASDPGGDEIWRWLLERNVGRDVWMARRGPLAPDSAIACVLYDFGRAMKRLPLGHQAIVALTAMGFSPTEIAEVLDPASLTSSQPDRRSVESKRRRIARVLEGTPKRDREGQPVRDEDGATIMVGGAARKLARYMTGDR